MTSTLVNCFKISKNVNNFTKLFSNLTLSANNGVTGPYNLSNKLNNYAQVHTTSCKRDLMEFFDEEKNWEKVKIQVGREWRTDELRIKSNEDLHKLWFVLLKERNMLITMENACKKAYKIFPNPERFDKVEMSMENLEKVVRERNEAYYHLETGMTGERPTRIVRNFAGLVQRWKCTQHFIPRYMNRAWREKDRIGMARGMAVSKFLRKFREKVWDVKRRERNKQERGVIQAVRRWPHVSREALEKKFPHANIDKALSHNKVKYLQAARLND